MAHQIRKGMCISISNHRAERRQSLCVHAIAHLDSREALGIRLDPCRRVTGKRVLPGTKPQKYNFEIVFAGTFEETIYTTEIKFSFLGFDRLPRDGQQYGIQV